MASSDPCRHYRVPATLAGERLDRVLAELASGLTRSAAQRLLRDDRVSADGVALRPSDRAVAGQLLTVRSPLARPLDLIPEDHDLDIVHEDEHLLVVNKPPGMVVHPAHGHHEGTLVHALLAHCRLSSAGGEVRPGIVHRLDRDTSGLLLVAKTDAVHAELSRMVEHREVTRRYLALVWGGPERPRGRIETTLGRHPQRRTMMAVLGEGHGRIAITDYEVRERYRWEWRADDPGRPRRRDATLLQCVLQTGRTHQIRVHAAHLGIPIVADPLYGDAERDHGGPEKLNALVAAMPGQALHAAELAFDHPVTGHPMALSGTPAEAMGGLLRWLQTHREEG